MGMRGSGCAHVTSCGTRALAHLAHSLLHVGALLPAAPRGRHLRVCAECISAVRLGDWLADVVAQAKRPGRVPTNDRGKVVMTGCSGVTCAAASGMKKTTCMEHGAKPADWVRASFAHAAPRGEQRLAGGQRAARRDSQARVCPEQLRGGDA